MNNEWKEVKQEIFAYREYVKSLPPESVKEAVFSYLITSEEINRMLGQQCETKLLDGLRAYFGLKIIGNKMIPTLHMIACKKDSDGNYNDHKGVAAACADKKSMAYHTIRPRLFWPRCIPALQHAVKPKL